MARRVDGARFVKAAVTAARRAQSVFGHLHEQRPAVYKWYQVPVLSHANETYSSRSRIRLRVEI